MKHWAAEFIGLPWSPERNCWWLVREVFKKRWGVDMPAVGVGELQVTDNVAAIKEAASASGWRPVHDGDPADGDILLCRDVTGKRHVGVMLQDGRRLLLLHNDGHVGSSGQNVGSVVAQPLRDAIADGMTDIELWRRA